MKKLFNFFNIQSWLLTMFPAGLIIGLGVVQFKDAVLQSVQMSPHPQIIYLIAIGFVSGVTTLSIALYRCLSERDFLLNWSSKNKTDAAELLRQFSNRRSITPLLMVIGSMHDRAPQTQHEHIEKEVEEFDKAIHQGFTFPAYVSGALIGLGLVGTFVGLLGSLQEMADIISSMMNSSSSNGQSPFSEMLRKLKRPMEGMGTAFVASMYGLMGSLLLEWMLTSVRRVCNQILLNTRETIRRHEMAEASIQAPVQGAVYSGTGMPSDQFLSITSELQSNQQLLTRILDKHQDTEQIWLKSQEEYISAVANRKLIDRNTQELLLSNLQVNQQSLQAQEANRLQLAQLQEAFQDQSLQSQEANKQQLLQVQEVFQQQTLQVQETNKQQLLQVQEVFQQQALQAQEANQQQLAQLQEAYRLQALQTQQAQETYQQHTLQAQEAYQQQTLQNQEANKQQLLQVQESYQLQVLQVQEAYKQHVHALSDHLSKQFDQISVHTQQLNLQVAELNRIYQSALDKPHALIQIWTSVKGIFADIYQLITKKKP